MIQTKKQILAITILVCILTAWLNTSSFIGKPSPPHQKDSHTELVIGLNEQQNNYNKLIELAAKFEGKIVNTVKIKDKIKNVIVSLPSIIAFNFTSQIQESKLATYIESNHKFKVNFTPNDPNWNMQWGPKKIRANYAWNTTVGNHSILVAVIDTGIDWNHPDLAPNYVPLGYDWVNSDSNPMDDHGHGTHCAGIIAAATNNSVGIAGLAQVQIMAEKGLDQSGEGTEDDLANAIYHAVNQGAKILSCSWGSYEDSTLIHEALTYAYDHDVLIVAAAGNDYSSNRMYPAAYEEVVAVTATDQNDNPASFSNYGEWVELAAPGVSIYSTIWDNTYSYMSGTSMATPHVAGVAALVWSQNPSMTRDQLRNTLRFTADDLGASGFDPYYGFGRVNAEKAVTKPLLDHDIWVYELEAPSSMRPATTAIINATITNIGKNNESNIITQLLINSSLTNSTTIDFLACNTFISVIFMWTPTTLGKYNITCFAVPVPDEDATENNALSKHVIVRFPMMINVPKDYESIQSAVDAAIPEDIVRVASGTYYENVVVSKPLLLMGENKRTTIVDGDYYGTVLSITSDNVTVKGFTIQKSEFWACGIKISNSKNCIVRGNILRLNYYGLRLDSCANCSVTLNILEDNYRGAIRFDGCQNCTANGNFVDKNYYGIHYDSCMACRASLNVVSNNTYGVWFRYCGNCIIDGNQVNNSRGYGIFFVDSQGCVVRENTISKNYRGMRIQRSPEIVVPSYFYHNNLISNTKQILMEAGFNEWDDGYPLGGNYWSDYTGDDFYSGVHQNQSGSDGIGDSPYIIDENNKDRYPLMSPWNPATTCDITISNVSSLSETYVGWTLNVTVFLENKGTNEAVEVSLFYGDKLIETKAVNLSGSQRTTVIFQWSTAGLMPYVNYLIWAEVSMILGETNFANNIFYDGFVRLKMFADVNGDKVVNLRDIAMAVLAFGEDFTKLRWNPQADLNRNGKIDIIDIAIVAKNFGKTWTL